eukprot:7454619-Pyramimonas_sp.AAC.1
MEGVAVFSRSQLHTAVPIVEERLLFPKAEPVLPSQWAVQSVRFPSVGIAFVSAYSVAGVGLAEPNPSLLS